MNDEKVRRLWEEMFGKLSISQLIKDIYFDGYDSYEDYVKYGDAFVRIDPDGIRPPGPMFEVKFEPRDIWVGLFWDRRIDGLHIYVCPVPCIVFHWRKPNGQQRGRYRKAARRCSR